MIDTLPWVYPMKIFNLMFRVAIAATAAMLLAPVQGNAVETVRLVIAGRASSLQWPIFIGVAKGFFESRGLALDISTAQSTSAAIQQVIGGSGDIGVGGLSDPIRAIDKGAKLVLLRIETQVPPFSLWGKPSIKSIKDLRGKTVMLGGAKDITVLYFERMAAPNDLHSGDYDLILRANPLHAWRRCFRAPWTPPSCTRPGPFGLRKAD